ncbi:hypothetical protein NDN08_007384 [Rhodosorus marinus]|uniref:Uncharacterized protein n=1 Tax=Rhodosorus marinus TaxID=101924 RepID=A0AAV8UYY6_9RHOD|nr:hypothetical protein NDN08_007384 [Rhodosorus marinus]
MHSSVRIVLETELELFLRLTPLLLQVPPVEKHPKLTKKQVPNGHWTSQEHVPSSALTGSYHGERSYKTYSRDEVSQLQLVYNLRSRHFQSGVYRNLPLRKQNT